MTLLDALTEGPARLRGEDVAAAQRRRLLAAMVSAASDLGYANVSVANVVGRARVSRATFYEQFGSKEECFLAAVVASVDELLGAMRTGGGDGAAPRDRVRTLLAAYLHGLAAFPDFARVCLVEIYAAGTAGAKLRRDMQNAFVALLREEAGRLVASGEAGRMPSDFEIEVLVGAISSLVTTRVATGDAAELPSLVEPLESFVLRALRAG